MDQIIVALIMFICGIGVGYGLTSGRDEECPRELMGYQCRYGDRCDHSPEAVAKAKQELQDRLEADRQANTEILASHASEILGENIEAKHIGGKK